MTHIPRSPMMQAFPHYGEGPTVCAKCGGEAPPKEGASHTMLLPLCAGCQEKLSAESEESRRRHQAEDEARAEAQRVARIREPLGSIPSHYQGVTFDLPEVSRRVRRQEAIHEARHAVDDQVAMITLIGGAGSGKTTLASAILHRVVERALAGENEFLRLGRSARWVAAPSLARARRRYKLGVGEPPLIEDSIHASLLVLDDLGMEHGDPDGGISDVLYERHAHDAPTVVTTNLRYADLCERYGTGIARRIAESGVTSVIRCAHGAVAASAGLGDP